MAVPWRGVFPLGLDDGGSGSRSDWASVCCWAAAFWRCRRGRSVQTRPSQLWSCLAAMDNTKHWVRRGYLNTPSSTPALQNCPQALKIYPLTLIFISRTSALDKDLFPSGLTTELLASGRNCPNSESKSSWFLKSLATWAYTSCSVRAGV